jgi:Na+/H+ antiporter NhaD/arsenite permease-like protein
MSAPAVYSLPWALPFLGLLLTIALAPHFAPVRWQRYYAGAALAWSLAFVLPDLVRGGAGALGPLGEVALYQYIPFALLLGTLYVITGGIRITGAPRGTPAVNTALLALGTVLAGVIGSPGATLLLVRPLISANRHRARSAHVFVFLILLVANIGGALTPIGNPPLLLGYLKGVPFLWPMAHLAFPTATLAAGLLATFYALDYYLQGRARQELLPEIEKLGFEGGVNLALLVLALAAVLLRTVWTSPPGLVDLVSDLLLLAAAIGSLTLTRPATRKANGFAWGPIIEVAVLFAAIFVTLIPVIAMMTAGAQGPAAPLFARVFGAGSPDNVLIFRVSGLMSAFLDNAPTYLVFFGLAGNDAARLAGPMATTLAAISAGACYFGGLTYLGNAPNLMVRAMLEKEGIRMPGFFGYLGWAAVCLVPWLLLVEALFFH